MAYTVKQGREEVRRGAGIAHESGFTAIFYKGGVRQQAPAKEFGLVVTGSPDSVQ